MTTVETWKSPLQPSNESVKVLRIVPRLAEIAKPAFAPEQTARFRLAIAIILGRDSDDSDFNYRGGIALALERLRKTDARTLQLLRKNIDECHSLLKTEEPLLTDDEQEKTRKETIRTRSASQIKLCRFLLASYFTEKWWQFREDINGVERVFGPLLDQPNLWQNEKSQLPLSYDRQLYELYNKSLNNTPFDCRTQIEAGISTGRFYSDSLCRLWLGAQGWKVVSLNDAGVFTSILHLHCLGHQVARALLPPIHQKIFVQGVH